MQNLQTTTLHKKSSKFGICKKHHRIVHNAFFNLTQQNLILNNC